MSKLEEIKNDEKECAYFSQLVHDYSKLAAMRVMQNLRERWKLDAQESQELIFSIIGRQMNEACYALAGAMKGSGLKANQILPQMTIGIIKGIILEGESIDPMSRTDIDKSVEHFKEFLSDPSDDIYREP